MERALPFSVHLVGHPTEASINKWRVWAVELRWVRKPESSKYVQWHHRWSAYVTVHTKTYGWRRRCFGKPRPTVCCSCQLMFFEGFASQNVCRLATTFSLYSRLDCTNGAVCFWTSKEGHIYIHYVVCGTTWQLPFPSLRVPIVLAFVFDDALSDTAAQVSLRTVHKHVNMSLSMKISDHCSWCRSALSSLVHSGKYATGNQNRLDSPDSHQKAI